MNFLNLKTSFNTLYSQILFNKKLINNFLLSNTYKTCEYNKGYIIIKNTYSNLFIVLTDSNFKVLNSFSLGTYKLKNKKQRSSKLTLNFLYTKISNLIEQYKLYNITIYLKHSTFESFKLYKYFITIFKLSFFKIQIQNTSPHGGCRPPKKRRT